MNRFLETMCEMRPDEVEAFLEALRSRRRRIIEDAVLAVLFVVEVVVLAIV